jgi:hypothetical protein
LPLAANAQVTIVVDSQANVPSLPKLGLWILGLFLYAGGVLAIRRKSRRRGA